MTSRYDNVASSIEEFNRLAMVQLTTEKYSHAIAYLNQALFKVRLMEECQEKNSLAALTYNNLGCFYKRIGQIDNALEYFSQSLDFENNGANSSEGLANTHLNISCLLSLKKEHEKALRYAVKALMILKKAYKDHPQFIKSILNCYQRIGIEYKSLLQFSQALQCFKKGYEICSRMKNSGNLKKSFKRMHDECLGELGNSHKLDQSYPISKSKQKSYRISVSPKSSLDSHTTVWSQSTSYKPNTPKNFEKPFTSHNRRTSLVLPPVEEFNIGKKQVLGSVYEIEEVKKRKINAGKHRAQENLAAQMIQSCWRGYVQRKRYYQIMISKKIKQAENKARKAIEEIKTLKSLVKYPQRPLISIKRK